MILTLFFFFFTEFYTSEDLNEDFFEDPEFLDKRILL